MSELDTSRLPQGSKGFTHDFGADQTVFKGVPWGKAMMWIFLLSDTFIFSCFLISLMTARASTTAEWPFPSEVFGQFWDSLFDNFGINVGQRLEHL